MKHTFSKTFYNVWILFVVGSFSASVLPLMHTISSLAANNIIQSVSYATFPISLMIIGTAISVVFATFSMKHLGRKRGLMFLLSTGLCACLLAAYALDIENFYLFSLAAFLLGALNATIHQMRFVALEAVKEINHATAAAIFMSSGIFAAFLGPEIGFMGKDIFEVEFKGSFILAAILVAISMISLCLFNELKKEIKNIKKTKTSTSKLLSNPIFVLALASGSTSYLVMSFIMVGTPLSMHEIHGHSLESTKWVIQSHIAAMFLPTFITPFLTKLFGFRKLINLGLILFTLASLIGFYGSSVSSFWFQLVLLGVGWNFLFFSATTILPQTYAPKHKFKAQTLNDTIVLSFQALAALSAGFALHFLGWDMMIIFCAIPILAMLMMLIWERKSVSNSRSERV